MIQKTKFKETEIGLIPEDWDMIQLKELFKISAGGDLKKLTFSKEKFDDYKYPIYSNSLNNRGLYGFSKAFQYEPECVTITGRGDVGTAECRKEPFNAIVRLLVLKPKQDISCYFVASFINTKLDFSHVGSAVNQLTAPAISTVRIAVPPISEQKAIAKILSDLDSKIDLLQKQNNTLEKIGQVLFKQWFVDFEFPTEEGKPYRSSGGKMVESELGEIPEGWEIKELQNFIELQKGLSYKGKSLVEEGGLPMANLGTFLPIKGFKSDGLKHYDGEHKERHLVSPGDMLIANTDITQKRDILGSPAIIPKEIGSDKVLFTHHTFAVRFRDNTLPKPYLYYLLQTPEYRQRAIGFATGTTVLALPKDAILELSFVLPNNGLLGKFKEITKSIFEKRGVNEQSILYLSKTRDSLLPKLMTGKIRVPLEVRE